MKMFSIFHLNLNVVFHVVLGVKKIKLSPNPFLNYILLQNGVSLLNFIFLKKCQTAAAETHKKMSELMRRSSAFLI